MFELVNNIESYPQFMSGCVGAEITARGEDWLEARLDLSRFGIKQSFSTHNTLNPPSSMTLSLLDGPFKSLLGEWQFVSLDQSACKVVFWLEFEVSNSLAALALPKLMEHVASDQVTALCRRAKQVYR